MLMMLYAHRGQKLLLILPLIGLVAYFSSQVHVMTCAGVVTVIYFAILRWRVRRSFSSFCDDCLRSDLRDISEHYEMHGSPQARSASKSCFWVAEVVGRSGGKVVVGMIGLGTTYVFTYSKYSRGDQITTRIHVKASFEGSLFAPII